MNSLRPARSAPDRLFFALGARSWDARRVYGYEEVSRTLGAIDAKPTGLLKHTSMIIAGLRLIASLVAELPVLYFWSPENTA